MWTTKYHKSNAQYVEARYPQRLHGEYEPIILKHDLKYQKKKIIISTSGTFYVHTQIFGTFFLCPMKKINFDARK
jgi:hypothetical protein